MRTERPAAPRSSAPSWLAALLVLTPAFRAQTAETRPVDPLQREERWPSGAIKARWRVDDAGRRHGACLAWHENGTLRERSWYVLDRLDGLHEVYWSNGRLALSESRRAGLLEGRSVERSEDAQREVRTPFVKGKVHGRVDVVEKGRVTSTQEWKDGALVLYDGVPAFPKSQESIRSTLASIYGADDPAGQAVADTPDGALTVLKAYRFLCDLPWSDLTLDPTMNAHAAAGANLCRRIGRLDHTPANPGMPEAEYRFAFTGTSSSNLSRGTSLPGSVHAYMDDSDPSNIDRVGHRRWCLNPAMRRTGFGKDAEFSAMWSFDASRPRPPEFDFVCYPPRGYLPVRYFGAQHAFSVHFNPSRYRAPDITSTEIEVTPLDARYLRSGQPLKIENERAHATGAGVPYCLVFRPRGFVVTPGARYLVSIQLAKEKPARQNLRWIVEFVP